MAELAATQVQRLVSLIAWMSQGDSAAPVSVASAARRLGVSAKTLEKDLGVLIGLTEDAKSWLSSLQVAITAEGFILGSLGAFQRPLRLTGDEALALMLGLLQGRDGHALARRLGKLLQGAPATGEVERTWVMGPTPGEGVARVLGMIRRARDQRRKLEIRYCGSSGEPSRRVVHPHQVVMAGGVWYLIAWCEKSAGPRHFRVERILEVAELDATFTPNPAVARVKDARDLLSAAEPPAATVAFSARIARWIRERYPGGTEAPDGRYVVKLLVADPRWLVREVLQYGAEAEVLEPEGMRDLVRGMVW